MAFGYDFGLTATPAVNVFIGLLIVWALIWKGFGLWFSARNRQKIWFVALLILNTAGILPIIYLLFFRRKRFFKPKEIKRIIKKAKKPVKRKIKRKRKR